MKLIDLLRFQIFLQLYMEIEWRYKSSNYHQVVVFEMFSFFPLHFTLSVLSKICMICMHYFYNQREIIQTTDTFGEAEGRMEV